MQLYTRAGAPTAASVRDAKGKPFYIYTPSCSRCGGAGRSDKWAHTGFTCFDCNGSGQANRTVKAPLYTQEQLDRLNAAATKRNTAKAEKIAAERAKVEAEATARREAFEAEYAAELAWLRAQPESFEFARDVLAVAQRAARLGPGQLATIRRLREAEATKAAQRASSQHVGQPGDRITAAVTVERVRHFERTKFNADWITETVYIVTMRDDAGNALTSKSPSFSPTEGAKLTIKATVKEHSEFNGEKQTVLQRIKG